MQAHRTRRRLAAFYVVLFFLFLLLPLVVTAGAALNDSAFPSIIPWKGFTGHWFAVLFGDPQLALTAVRRVLSVTADEVREVAAATLRPDNRAVLVYEPTGPAAEATDQDEEDADQ